MIKEKKAQKRVQRLNSNERIHAERKMQLKRQMSSGKQTHIPAGETGDNNGVHENLNNKFGNTEMELSRYLGRKGSNVSIGINSVNPATGLGNHKKDLCRSISC